MNMEHKTSCLREVNTSFLRGMFLRGDRTLMTEMRRFSFNATQALPFEETCAKNGSLGIYLILT